MKPKYNRRESNIRLRDENIRMSEERGRKIEQSEEGIDLGFSPAEIRKKLRRKNGKNKKA